MTTRNANKNGDHAQVLFLYFLLNMLSVRTVANNQFKVNWRWCDTAFKVLSVLCTPS
jgi:hypothetical protein